MLERGKASIKLLSGSALLYVALAWGSAHAAERNFLPLHQKTAVNGMVSPQTGRQFIPLNTSRNDTARTHIALHGGANGKDRSWKLSELRRNARNKAAEVPDDVKLAMAAGAYAPHRGGEAATPAEMMEREQIAAALAPLIGERHSFGADDIDTDIEDVHEALAASLPDVVQDMAEAALAYVWPVVGGHQRISSGYGYRKHPVTGKRAFHAGIDIPAPSGTTVVAAAAGEVAGVGEHPRLGRYVRIDHEDGTYSLYGHLQKWTAKMGQMVRAGDPIGHVGSTGRSTGPHLDFSIRREGKPFNPMTILADTLEQKTLAYNP